MHVDLHTILLLTHHIYYNNKFLKCFFNYVHGMWETWLVSQPSFGLPKIMPGLILQIPCSSIPSIQLEHSAWKILILQTQWVPWLSYACWDGKAACFACLAFILSFIVDIFMSVYIYWIYTLWHCYPETVA